MRVAHGNRLTGLLLPPRSKKAVVVGVEFACRVIRNIQQALLGVRRDCSNNEKSRGRSKASQPARQQFSPLQPRRRFTLDGLKGCRLTVLWNVDNKAAQWIDNKFGLVPAVDFRSAPAVVFRLMRGVERTGLAGCKRVLGWHRSASSATPGSTADRSRTPGLNERMEQ